jgi:AraC-like DNA-binding protein
MNIHKEKSVFATLIISYLIVLLIPLSTMCLIYINIEDILQKQISEYYYGYLQQNVQSSDLAVSDLSNLMASSINNSKIQEFAMLGPEGLEDKLYNIMNERRLYLTYGYNNILEDMFIYFKNTGFVSGLSSCGNAKDYYSINYKEIFENYDDWENIIQRKHIMEFITVEQGGKYNVFYVCSIFNPGTREVAANIVLKVKSDALLSDMQRDNEMSLIINDEGGVVLASTESDTQKIAIMIEGEREEKFNLEFNGNDYIVLKAASNINNWRYIYCINKSGYMGKVIKSRQIIVTAIILCVLLSIAIILYLSKNQYEPVRRITSELAKKFGVQGEHESEYQYIENVIKRIMKEGNNSAARTFAESEAINELALSKMLLGERCNEKLYRTVGKSFRFQNFLVVMLGFEEIHNIFFEDDMSNHEDDEALAKFIVCNVVRDILGREFEIKICDINKKRLILISMENQENTEKLYDGIYHAQNLIATSFNVKFIAALSDVHMGIEEISKCYREAKEAFESGILSSDSILKYSEVVNDASGSNYYYPLKVENQLISLLKASDYEKSKKLVNNIINENAAKCYMSPLSTKCLAYDIVATALKVLNEVDVPYEEVFDETGVGIEQWGTLESIRKFIFGVLQKICTVTGKVSVKNGHRISKQVKDFVDLNYNDQNLSVAYISEYLDVSVNYLTKIVKQHTGMTLLEYITMVRIEKAKQQLKDSNSKLEDIAVRVGYNNVRTFTRVFTKYVGISPGKYRNNG